MGNSVIGLSEKRVIDAFSQLSHEELKKITDSFWNAGPV